MNFKVMLTGGNFIIVDETQKDILEPYFLSSQATVIKVGNNTVYTRDIKGIFEIENNTPSYNKNYIEDLNREFNDKMQFYADQLPEEKAKREMRSRLLPGWTKSGGKREDPELRVVYEWILEFFVQNPQHPWCPVALWWDILRGSMRKTNWSSKFYEYVMRHDSEVDKWLKWRGIV